MNLKLKFLFFFGFCKDCLQLCLKHNAFSSMVDHLLHAGLRTNSVDYNSNNVLHLVILYENPLRSLEFLLRVVDMNLLFAYNDDGFTPLQLAVNCNRYLMLEFILNYLDNQLNDNQEEVLQQRRRPDYNDENFQQFYFNACKQFINDNTFKEINTNMNPLKRKILEAPEKRTGNTMLITAAFNYMGKYF